jgi:hypothetical protein
VTSFTLVVVDSSGVEHLLMDTALPLSPRVGDLIFKEKKNAAPTLTFDIDVDHPARGVLINRAWVRLDEPMADSVWFQISIPADTSSAVQQVTATGLMACLGDTLIIPGTDYAGTCKGFIELVCAIHNAQAVDSLGNPDPRRQLAVGNISSDLDPNDYITRSQDGYPAISTWEWLRRSTFGNDALADSTVKVRSVQQPDGKWINYVDWLSATSSFLSPQTLRYGGNIQTWRALLDEQGVYTACLPFGAVLNEENTERLMLSVDDPGATPLWTNPANGEISYGIVDAERAAVYGRLAGSATWDDVTTGRVLAERAAAWVAARKLPRLTFDATALDGHIVDENVPAFAIGQKVKVEGPLGITDIMPILSTVRPLADPTGWKITVGAEAPTIMSSLGQVRDTASTLVSLADSDARLGVQVNNAWETAKSLSSVITQTAAEIRAEVAQTYVTSDSHMVDVEELRANLSLTAEGILAEFSAWQQTQYADDLGQQQSNWDELNLWLRTSVDGLQIGRDTSPYQVLADDDEFRISKDGLILFQAKAGRVAANSLHVVSQLSVGNWRWVPFTVSDGEVFGCIYSKSEDVN